MVKTTSSRDTLEARPIPGQRRGATAGGPLAWGQSAVGAVGPPPRLSPRALHALSESIPTAGRRLVPPPPEVRDLPNATPLAPNVNPTHPQRPPARASAPHLHHCGQRMVGAVVRGLVEVAVDRYTVISADCHAGADLYDYRPYLESRYHDEFDAWAATYVHP